MNKFAAFFSISVLLLFCLGVERQQELESRGEKKIPRIIHQTYSSLEAVPVEFKKIMENVQEVNANWDYRFYDDSDILDFIKEYYSEEVLEAYLKINPKYGPAKADLFRYLVIYKLGGVYLDCKVATTKPLDKVIRKDDELILSHWDQCYWAQELEIARGELQNWHVISIPGHPLLKAVIDSVVSNINNYSVALDGMGKEGVLRVTGPIAYTKTIFPLLSEYPHRLVNNEKALYLDYGDGSHGMVMQNHYSKIQEPIVLSKHFVRMSAQVP